MVDSPSVSKPPIYTQVAKAYNDFKTLYKNNDGFLSKSEMKGQNLDELVKISNVLRFQSLDGAGGLNGLNLKDLKGVQDELDKGKTIAEVTKKITDDNQSREDFKTTMQDEPIRNKAKSKTKDVWNTSDPVKATDGTSYVAREHDADLTDGEGGDVLYVTGKNNTVTAKTDKGDQVKLQGDQSKWTKGDKATDGSVKYTNTEDGNIVIVSGEGDVTYGADSTKPPVNNKATKGTVDRFRTSDQIPARDGQPAYTATEHDVELADGGDEEDNLTVDGTNHKVTVKADAKDTINLEGNQADWAMTEENGVKKYKNTTTSNEVNVSGTSNITYVPKPTTSSSTA